jgi:hypothetical protein
MLARGCQLKKGQPFNTSEEPKVKIKIHKTMDSLKLSIASPEN